MYNQRRYFVFPVDSNVCSTCRFRAGQRQGALSENDRFWYNLSDSLQVGLSPTITYDDNAESGNKWNVPVGLGLAKMLKIGNTMTRIEAVAEYSVEHEDDFGERARFKINFIPIINRPIRTPIFGGG